jgi:hypothetical protein
MGAGNILGKNFLFSGQVSPFLVMAIYDNSRRSFKFLIRIQSQLKKAINITGQ